MNSGNSLLSWRFKAAHTQHCVCKRNDCYRPTKSTPLTRFKFLSHVQVTTYRLQEQMLKVLSIYRGKLIMGWREMQYQWDSLLIKLHSEGPLKAICLMVHFYNLKIPSAFSEDLSAEENLLSPMKCSVQKSKVDIKCYQASKPSHQNSLKAYADQAVPFSLFLFHQRYKTRCHPNDSSCLKLKDRFT